MKQCVLHQKHIDLYCKDCVTLLCSKCLLTHKNHTILDIEDYCNELKKKSIINLVILKKEITSLKEIKDVEEKKFQDVKDEHNYQIQTISGIFEELRILINLKELTLIKGLETNHKGNTELYSSILSSLESKINSKLKIIDNINNNNFEEILIQDINNHNSNSNNNSNSYSNCNLTHTKSYSIPDILTSKFQSIKDSIKSIELNKIRSIPTFDIGKCLIENNNKNEELFFKVWRISNIRNEISKYIKWFILNEQISFPNPEEYSKYEFKDYMTGILISKNNFKYLNHLSPSIQTLYIGLGNEFEGIIPSHITKLYIEFNFPLKPGFFPNSLTDLKLGNSFNQKLVPGDIPNSVTSLSFNGSFNQTLTKGVIPNSVETLRIRNFNQALTEGIIPISVTDLAFLEKFDKEISVGSIPSSVKTLELTGFNQPLVPGLIPEGITSLNFGSNFNQPITIGTLPSSLTKLVFGYHFDQVLKQGCIPDTIKELKFSKIKTLPELGVGPKSALTKLSVNILDNVNSTYLFSPIRVIPTTVIELSLSYSFDLLDIIPSSVTTLSLYGYYRPLKAGSIPNSVTSLTFGYEFNQPLVKDSIPSSVTSLTLGKSFNQLLNSDSIPNSVTNLKFGYDYNQPLFKGCIPPSVTDLELGYLFNQPLNIDSIPPLVTNLNFGGYFNQPIEPKILPSSVNKIVFGDRFNQYLNIGTIPSNVTFLKFGNDFDQELVPNVLPLTLETLIFGNNFSKTLVYGCLPGSIKVLTFSDNGMFNKFIHLMSLPLLSTLKLPLDYPHPLSKNNIPSSVFVLKIGGYLKNIDKL